MDVPFHSSGAISRAHYAIVRRVETANTVQTADQHILLEIKSLEEKLAHPKLSIDKCKEYLIILLYCATAVTPGFLANDALEFGYLHAINLAEAGKKIEDKRIGYLFCSEVLPKDHELRLMLVNTIRKDLESTHVPQICMALDNLITSPSEAVIPAVQSRLHDLLSHDNAHVKRRTLFAFRALSTYEPALIEGIQLTLIKLLEDSDDSVVKASLTLISDYSLQDAKGKNKVTDILVTESSYINETNVGIILQALKAVRILGIVESRIPILFEILREHSNQSPKNPLSRALILEIFRTLNLLSAEAFAAAEDSNKLSCIHSIRHFLMSEAANENYLFMSCLECVDAINWAGTSPERPSSMQAEDFERIMQMLNFSDRAIAKKTMHIIKNVDPSLLDMQVSLITQTYMTNSTDPSGIWILLDIILIRCNEDGGKYGASILELIQNMDKNTTKPRVSKEIVETVLTDIRVSRSESNNFAKSAATHFAHELLQTQAFLGPTALVIGTALITEYFDALSITPPEILYGLASRLKTLPAIVQEPCILAMLRVSASCDEIPPEVSEIITDLSKTARQVIRDRCTQFVEYSQKKDELLLIVQRASSSSLPDFLASLQNHISAWNPQTPATQSRILNQTSSLRYEAYAPPQVGPRLNLGRTSSSQISVSSYASSQHGSPLLTAGQLALTQGLEDIHISRGPGPVATTEVPTLIDLQASRADLISLESPCQMEPLRGMVPCEDGPEFIDIWNSFEGLCDLRGWCKNSIDAITRRLQRFDEVHHLRVVASDMAPFEGELKVLMVTDEKDEPLLRANAIALRLRESEEDSCVWRLRCADSLLGTKVEVIINI